MLHLQTSDEFAGWFGTLDDKAAEEVATALDVIERLGPERAAPGSRELLLVRRAERAWKQFLEGDLRVNEAGELRR